jgi:hypothetical protein
VQIDEVDRLTGTLDGVHRGSAGGLAQWRYHGFAQLRVPAEMWRQIEQKTCPPCPVIPRVYGYSS